MAKPTAPSTTDTTQKRLIPTGVCWCGCKGEPKLGSFFCVGHNMTAMRIVITAEYGSVANFLYQRGYAPGGDKELGNKE